jgi:hypothetical protein
VKKFHLGPLAIDPAEYGSQGNAVLGIRGSGKSYTATELGELLFDAGVPWLAFDPTGIWRFIRVPGKGKGYPVVVAGGKEGDLPLTVAGTPALVRAAMENGISLVFDLHGAMLSKADWRRVVTSAVRILMQENAEHGLRHIFIEEAAEFVPQRPIDWDVYAELERLARVGGNSRLGYTLINQRSQEVNKAVLELCENIFLHRQRGKNALDNLDKWLQIAGAAEQQSIIRSMPDLPNGQCWAWIGGDKPMPPKLITVPEKNSFHPDRRVMRGDAIKTKAKPVDVGAFVEGMKGQLEKIVEEAKANDPKELRLKIAALQRELAAKPATAGMSETDRQAAYDGGYQAGEKAGAHFGYAAGYSDAIVAAGKAVSGLSVPGPDVRAINPTPPSRPRPAAPLPAPRTSAPPPRPISSAPAEGLSRPQQRILDALAELAALGIREASRIQVVFLSGYGHPNSKGFVNSIGALSTAGYISYPRPGTVALTESGASAANHAGAPLTSDDLQRRVLNLLGAAHGRILQPLIDAYPNAISREDLCAAAGYGHMNSKGFVNAIGRLRSFGFIDYPAKGQAVALPVLFVDG